VSQLHIVELVGAYVAGLLTIPFMVIVVSLFTDDTPDTDSTGVFD
jgi:hypothetical protein